MTKDADDLRSAAVRARELADLLDGYLNSPQQVALGEELRSVLDSALAAAPAPQPTAAQKIDPNITPENQWFGDMMILQVLADSDQVNDQEREVLQRWIAASQPPGAQHGGPSDAEMLDWMEHMNATLNKRYGTTYGWKVILSPNVVRVMSERRPSDSGYVADIDVADSHARGCKTIREAIRAAMRATGGKTE